MPRRVFPLLLFVALNAKILATRSVGYFPVHQQIVTRSKMQQLLIYELIDLFHPSLDHHQEALLFLKNKGKIDHKNIQLLTPEMFRNNKELSLKIMTDVFLLKQNLNYNIKHRPDFSTRTVKSVYYGIESLGFLDPKFGS